MEDLQQAQILDSCRLALPEGLRDLMSDISREVLRARPRDLYQFIAGYLSALLEARDKLSIAAELYKDICNSDCSPELDEELRKIGLTEDEVEETKKVIIKYLEKDKVKEETLLAKLLKINIDERKLPAIQTAVRAAFRRNQMKKRPLDNLFKDDDDTKTAAKNTLKLYWKSKLTEERCFPVLDEGETPWYADEIDKEINDQRTTSSSTDSSDDIFKNIKDEGGTQDVYVSNILKPHLNSSLTPLNGSNGAISKRIEQELNVPEEENKFVNYNDEDEELTNKQSFELTSKEVHREAYKREYKPGDDENNNVNDLDEVDEFDHVVEKGDNDEVENIEDEAVAADGDSDISINEELNEDTDVSIKS